MVANFVNSLYKMYVDLYFTYLEINPLVVTDNTIYILDLAAKIDATADFVCRKMWGDVFYPPPFGRDAYPEEAYIADLDSKSGASLKVYALRTSFPHFSSSSSIGMQYLRGDSIVLADDSK